MGGTTTLLVTTSVIVGTAERSGRYNLNTSHPLCGDVEIYCAPPPELEAFYVRALIPLTERFSTMYMTHWYQAPGKESPKGNPQGGGPSTPG
jgi:hypothetical protein